MGAGQSKVTAQDRAILDMKIQRDKLKQYQRRIQTVLNRESEIARQCLKQGDKRRALLALRQRKYQETLLTKTDDQLMTLEQLTGSVEFALVEKDVLYGLSQGNQVLKAIHKEMSIEKAERILDETADAIAYQEEMSQLLGQQISNADEEAVLEEYERLQREVNPTLPAVPDTILIPDAPSHEVQAPEGQAEMPAAAAATRKALAA